MLVFHAGRETRVQKDLCTPSPIQPPQEAVDGPVPASGGQAETGSANEPEKQMGGDSGTWGGVTCPVRRVGSSCDMLCVVLKFVVIPLVGYCGTAC
mgnify:FL=1